MDLLVQGDNDALHRWFLGRAELADESSAGRITFSGPNWLQRTFPTWFNGGPLYDAIRSKSRAEQAASAG